VKAIEDELQRHKETYDSIVIATLPLQRSRWVALDQPRRIERRYKLPVIHVVGHSVTMTREELINGLNEDLNLELEAILRSVYHAAAGRGMLVRIRPNAPAELTAPRQLLDENIAAERKIITNYAKRIEQAAEFGDKGLVIRLEDILAAETDHLEELERLGR
jgi:hypothetical protein